MVQTRLLGAINRVEPEQPLARVKIWHHGLDGPNRAWAKCGWVVGDGEECRTEKR